jgi:hypothetical protein
MPSRRLRRLASHITPADGAPAATSRAPSSGALARGPGRLLTEREVASFWDDGFIVVHGLFAPEELQAMWMALLQASVAMGESVIKC